MSKYLSWESCAIALATIFGSAIIGMVSVVWGQATEIAVERERVQSLRNDISEMRASIEKKLDKIEKRIDEHMDKGSK